MAGEANRKDLTSGTSDHGKIFLPLRESKEADREFAYGCLEWSERTANVKIHGTTKRIPAEVFAEEREHLRPLIDCVENKQTVICRTIRKDNTVLYDSNRYSVPLDTYSTQKEVRIEPVDGVLHIQTLFREPICEHRINGRGLLIQNKSHTRDRSSGLDQMQDAFDILLENKATTFLQTIRTEKSRYTIDQFKLIQTLCEQYGVKDVLVAVDFCQYSKLSEIFFYRMRRIPSQLDIIAGAFINFFVCHGTISFKMMIPLYLRKQKLAVLQQVCKKRSYYVLEATAPTV